VCTAVCRFSRLLRLPLHSLSLFTLSLFPPRSLPRRSSLRACLLLAGEPGGRQAKEEGSPGSGGIRRSIQAEQQDLSSQEAEGMKGGVGGGGGVYEGWVDGRWDQLARGKSVYGESMKVTVSIMTFRVKVVGHGWMI
jgi:hypothetical protein